MNLAAWRKVLEKEPPPVVLIVGSEASLRRRALRAMRDALGVGADLERYGTDVPADELANAVQTIPFFGDARLAVLEGETLPAEQGETVLKLLPHILPPNYLALVLERVDKRTRLYQKLKGSTVECEPLKEAGLRKAARRFLDERGVNASPQALEQILAVAGGNLDTLENVSESLSLLVETGKELTAELVIQAAGSVPGFDPFRLCDLITEGKRAEACLLASRAPVSQDEIPRLVGLLARHYRILQLIRFVSRRQPTDKELARITGLNPYFLPGYKKAAGRHAAEELWGAQLALLDFDAACKRGLPSLETALLELVYALASKGSEGWPRFLRDLPGA